MRIIEPFLCKYLSGGDKGIRTPDLLHAKQPLSQLSYTPDENIITYFSEVIKCFGKNFVENKTVPNKSGRFICGDFLAGALQGTRTPDLLVRSQSLYPAELATLQSTHIIIPRFWKLVNTFGEIFAFFCVRVKASPLLCKLIMPEFCRNLQKNLDKSAQILYTDLEQDFKRRFSRQYLCENNGTSVGKSVY